MNYPLININDFKSVCRICLIQEEEMISCSTEIINMIEDCTSVQDSFHTKFPQQICYHCHSQLKSAYNFKQQCLISIECLCKILFESENDENKNINTVVCEQEDDSVNEEIISRENFQTSCFKVKITENILGKDNSSVKNESETNSTENKELSSGEKIEEFSKKRQQSLADLLAQEYNIYDLTCNVCYKKLSTRATLCRHMEIHNKKRNFKHKCTICNKGFNDRGNLNKHLNRHTGKPKYKCETCSKRFYELSALALHNKEKHKVQPIICIQCPLQFYHELQLEQHEQSHKQKENVCDICGKVLKDSWKLKDHRMAHTGERPFSCSHCGKNFRHNFNLKAHIRQEHIEHTKHREMCSVCGKLILPKNLPRHLDSHDKTTIIKCNLCERTYKDKYTLSVHMRERHPTDGVIKQYYCKICNKALSNSGSISKHMALKHSNGKKHLCSICGKGYKLPSHVKEHIQSAHMNLRPHACSLCDKAFHTKMILRQHMISHTGERPFVCTVCGKSFGTKTVLKTHMKVHSK